MIHVNLITNNIPASTNDLEESRIHIQQDKTLQIVIEYICNGWPAKKAKCDLMAPPYWNDRHNMTFIESLSMKGEKIVAPTVLKRDMLKLIHEGRMGMSKHKRRARQCLFWLKITNEIEKMFGKWEECSKRLSSKSYELLETQHVPSTPWTKTGSDITLLHDRRNKWSRMSKSLQLLQEVTLTLIQTP